jgi:hypothetical protein
MPTRGLAKGKEFKMVAVLLGTLFTASGLLALTVITASWLRYGAEARKLRAQIAYCAEYRTVRVRISEVAIHPVATVLRPDFTRAVRRPLQRAALPAAA